MWLFAVFFLIWGDILNPNEYKVLSNREVLELFGRKEDLPIYLNRDYYKQLKTNLLVPSVNQSYSCALEYMSNWFYSRFPDDFFKTKYVEASHIFNQLRTKSYRELLKVVKPAAVIRLNMDMGFNNENLDQYNYGNLLYNNRARYKDAFFIDKDHDLYISATMELLQLNFSYKIMVPYQGLQLDLAKKCQLIFRSGATQKHFNDVDYHIPSELLNQLAADTGNKVCPYNGSIIDATEFVRYFNMHSMLPLMYKFDAATGNMQYYLKMSNVYVHIRTNEINIDEGMREGQLMNNYTISFDCQVRFPTPKFYAYFSMKQRDDISCISKLDESSFVVTVTSLSNVPEKNDKGWRWNLRTEYEFTEDQDIEDLKAGKLMHIDFAELMGDFKDVIDATKHIAISPDVFLDIRVYSFYKLAKCSVDWQKYRINILEPIESAKCYIIIYMDTQYFNEQLINIKEYDKYRIAPTDTNIEHKRLDYKKNLKRASFERNQDKVEDTNEYTKE